MIQLVVVVVVVVADVVEWVGHGVEEVVEDRVLDAGSLMNTEEIRREGHLVVDVAAIATVGRMSVAEAVLAVVVENVLQTLQMNQTSQVWEAIYSLDRDVASVLFLLNYWGL